MKNIATALRSATTGPRLPNGNQVGFYSEEHGRRIWTRKVCLERHLLKIRDAWTINGPVLDQIETAQVERVRYVSDDGTYEVDLTEFRTRAELFEDFARGEDAYALPRAMWVSTSSSDVQFIPLFKLDEN